MRYVAVEEIILIHSEIIDATIGLHGVRDSGLLLSIVERPKLGLYGKEMYAGLWLKAAVYWQALACSHVFVDGNKRTAVAITARFLYLNNYQLTASNRAVEDFVLQTVIDKLPLEDIAAWLKKHVKK